MNEQVSPNQRQPLPPQSIVAKIDIIIQELENIKNMVVIPPSGEPETNLANKLFGVLGKGTREEYDPDLEWKRFAS